MLSKNIIKNYKRGIFTLNEAVKFLKDHILELFDNNHITETEADACILQVDRFYAGKITADDLSLYIGMVS